MDNVTHALAGCLLAAATVTLVERRHSASVPRIRGAATLVGIVAAELPDADLLYAGPVLGMGKLGYLCMTAGYAHDRLRGRGGRCWVWAAVMALRRAPPRGAGFAKRHAGIGDGRHAVATSR